jgi:pimeloyl-ACP methyl ester carboxylesterase
MKRFILALLLCVLVYGSVYAQDAPGELLPVADHQLHLDCQGEGSPTVVIDAGLASWSIHWRGVQESLAEFTQACIYDRAGYGWSEAGPEPRTAAQITGELDTLLQEANVEGPYVLVGHSFGGLLMQLFYAQHPDRVSGLVLVDSPNPHAETSLPEGWMEANAALYEQFPDFAGFAEQGFITPESIAVPPDYPEDIHLLYQEQLATAGFFNTAYSEITHIEESSAQVADAIESFGDLPLVVIWPTETAEIPANAESITPELWAAFHEANAAHQEELAALSTRGELVRAENSSHDTVQFEQPEVIVEAVQRVIELSQS